MKTAIRLFPILLLCSLVSCKKECDEKRIVAFEADQYRIISGESVSFFNESTGCDVSYEWTFEGGVPYFSTEENPIVTYPAEGFYDVSLTVIGGGELTLKKEKSITVVCTERYCNPDFSVVRTKDLVYGNQSAYHKFWLYEPQTDEETNRPMVLLFGGGGFNNASNLDYMEPLAELLASYGVVVATLQYRYGSIADPSDYLCRLTETQQDIRAAIRYFRKESTSFGINPDLIISGGYSSGAIGSLMQAYISYDELTSEQIALYEDCGGFDGEQGNAGFSDEVAGEISLGGIMISTVNWVKSGDAPLFLVCGLMDQQDDCDISYTDDGTFLKYGSIPMYNRAVGMGIHADFYSFPNGNHITPREEPAAYIDRLMAWLRVIIDEQQ